MIIIHGEAKKYKHLYRIKSGTFFKLSFMQHEVFGNFILSLDKIRKRLIISNVFNPLKMITLIDLCKVRLISVKKEYRAIQNGASCLSNPEDYLDTICLQFEFGDGSRSLFLPIFDKNVHDPRDISGLERKAVIWQLLLSKLKLQ